MPQQGHWNGAWIAEPRGFSPVAVPQSIPELQGRRPVGRDCRVEGKVWWRAPHPRRRRSTCRCGKLAKRVRQPCGQQFLGLGSTSCEVTIRVTVYYLLHEGLIPEISVPLACCACFCKWVSTCSAGCNAISGKEFDIRDCKRLQNVRMTIQFLKKERARLRPTEPATSKPSAEKAELFCCPSAASLWGLFQQRVRCIPKHRIICFGLVYSPVGRMCATTISASICGETENCD